MTSMFHRAAEIVEAKVNKFLNSAENPNETLDLSYEKMLSILQETKRHLADVVTEQKTLERQMLSAQSDSHRAENDARMALQAGREDLARAALAEKQAADQKAASLKEASTHVAAQSQKLIIYEKQLEDRIEQFRTQKEVMKSQYDAAQAEVKVSSSMAGVGNELGNVGEALQRAKDKTDQMQSRADAMESLTESGALDDGVDGRTKTERDLDALRASSGVDAELARLKGEIGQTKQLSPGQGS
ncbi:MAG: PspA/IM30 family protein [Planctomycetia bacterium]|jgi:phage shock protein A|nr:PspA/IM30 family protein [Planctomycetia bacterium]